MPQINFDHLVRGVSCSVGFSLDFHHDDFCSHTCGNMVSNSVCMACYQKRLCGIMRMTFNHVTKQYYGKTFERNFISFFFAKQTLAVLFLCSNFQRCLKFDVFFF